MASFEITIETGAERATVYTDSIEEFVQAMDARITGTSRRCAGQPKLEGYHGPTCIGQTDTGEPILRYEAA